MARPRSKHQREAHRAIIARASVERPAATARELAAELGVDHSTIVRDRQARLRDAEAHVDQALAVERAIQAEAWAGWHRSKADREQRRVIHGTGRQYDATRHELTVEQRVGDPDFLDAVGRSNARVIAMLGLAEPMRVNLDAQASVDADALADPDWLGAFIEAVGRVRYGTPTEEAAGAPPARPGLRTLDAADAGMGLALGDHVQRG